MSNQSLSLLQRAESLKLLGIVSHWNELKDLSLIENILQWEEIARKNHGLERRLKNSHIGRFKPLSQFDWSWPRKCDQKAIFEIMELDFIQKAMNVVLCGPNGVGKSMISCNIAHQSIMCGFNAVFITASEMLNDLAAQDGDMALQRKLKKYASPHVLIIDEVGYLSYSNRHADLLFEIISRRYEQKPTIITTNKPFAEWNQIFPSAACVVSMIDRLVHNSEIISIDADSYRLKEASENSTKRTQSRKSQSKKKTAEQQNEVQP